MLLTGNFWAEDDQAATLAHGNVSKFSVLVRWSALANRVTTRPPLVLGYSDRWYVTDLNLGQGVNSTVTPTLPTSRGSSPMRSTSPATTQGGGRCRSRGCCTHSTSTTTSTARSTRARSRRNARIATRSVSVQRVSALTAAGPAMLGTTFGTCGARWPSASSSTRIER